MTTNALVPLLSAIVSLVFAIFLFDQFLHRHRPHQLVWTLGFLWYAISSLAGFLGNLDGWSTTEYRWYYFFGGMAVPAYLGMGTVYLLAPRRLAHALFAVLLLGSLFAIFQVFTASLEASMLPAAAGAGEPGRGIFPASVRVLAPLFAVPGATALILGALWSAWVFWRKQAQSYRVTSNVLIAIGAFFPS
ncbi:MAG: hypothetical protein HYX89_08550, partial [Chloroflexi bacterium]|nr:hypothetical protein [Chloroflexota bacterium]